MELWDVYDKYRQKTGRLYQRGTQFNAPSTGDYYMVVHIWIVNSRGEYLIQKRAPWKAGFPNMWQCAASGAAISGDSSETAAIREVKEEIGLEIGIRELEPMLTLKLDWGFGDNWLVRRDVDINDLRLQYEEVSDARWVSGAELRDMADRGEFVRPDNLDTLFAIINSKISLKISDKSDAEVLLAMQKRVFAPIYEKYQDHDYSPVNQPMERFIKRFDYGVFYKVLYSGRLAGAVYVYRKKPGRMRLHIIFIEEEYQNKGITQETMRRLELMYPEAESWELDTIASEMRNCHVYEKMGYKRTEYEQVINDKLTVIGYEKMITR